MQKRHTYISKILFARDMMCSSADHEELQGISYIYVSETYIYPKETCIHQRETYECVKDTYVRDSFVQGGEEAQDALSLIRLPLPLRHPVFSRQEALQLVVLLQKATYNSRHLMHVRNPACDLLCGRTTVQCAAGILVYTIYI